MAHRFERVHPEGCGRRPRRQPPVRAKTEAAALERAAEQRVAATLGTRFAWFLAPVRIKAVAEDLRVLHRQRDLDLGVVVVATILAAYARSSDTEGRVRDAFAVYRQIDPTVDVVDEAFRKALIRSADVLLHLLQEWMRELTTREIGAPLRGRLSFFTDLLLTDSTAFKLARALVAGLPGSGSAAALKLYAIYSVRAQAAVSVEVTAGREHDSPHFDPVWVAGALYLWDLGYNDYARAVAAHGAGAFFVQRLKDKANPRLLAWYDAQGVRHAAPRGPRGALPRLNDVLATTGALQDGGVLDLDVVVEGDGVESVLRVVCVPIDGVDRYYLTNLPRVHFTPCDVAESYGSRWDVELLFKDWQGGCRLDEVARLSNLDTLRAVIYSSLLAHLLARELTRVANDTAPNARESARDDAPPTDDGEAHDDASGDDARRPDGPNALATEPLDDSPPPRAPDGLDESPPPAASPPPSPPAPTSTSLASAVGAFPP